MPIHFQFTKDKSDSPGIAPTIFLLFASLVHTILLELYCKKTHSHRKSTVLWTLSVIGCRDLVEKLTILQEAIEESSKPPMGVAM